MAWIGAAITAGAGLVGSAMSSSSASNLNAANRSWQTDMANTQMQRRVEDLKAANLNPYLAVTGGGGQGAAMPAPMAQNPGAAYQNLGQTAASAAQVYQQGKSVQSQVDLQGAQADASAAAASESRARAAKLAGIDTDFVGQQIADSQSMVVYRKLQGDATVAQAQLSNAQTQQAMAMLPQINASIDKIRSETTVNGVQARLMEAQRYLSSLNAEQVNWLMPSIVRSADNAARLSDLEIPGAKAKADFWSNQFGHASPYFGPVADALKLLLMAIK